MKQINECRKQLQQFDFPRFKKATSVFSEWNIANDFTEEIFQEKQVNTKLNLSKEKLFTIDFDESPIKNTLKAVFTLGFSTRKKASETLENVRNQESQLDEQIQRLEAEKIRLKKVYDSLKEIVDYFNGFHGLYEKLLGELEYSIDFVKSSYMLNSTVFFNNKIDVYYLPKRHLNCLMAAEKMTRIMYRIGSYKYLNNSLNIVKKDYKNIISDSQSVKIIKESLAA